MLKLMKTEVSALSPRVAFLDHQRLILNVDNSALKQRIAALAQDKIFKDGIMLCSFSFSKYFHSIFYFMQSIYTYWDFISFFSFDIIYHLWNFQKHTMIMIIEIVGIYFFTLSAHQEALKKEIERLRQIYHQQNLQKMNNNLQQTTPTSQPQQQPMQLHHHRQQQITVSQTLGCKDNKEQLLSWGGRDKE